MNVGSLNRLRARLRSAWSSNRDAPTPLIFLRDQSSEPDLAPLTTPVSSIASELGLRFIDLDLSAGLTHECRAKLDRPGPRLVLIRNLGRSPPDDLETIIRAKARSLILIDAIVEALSGMSEGGVESVPEDTLIRTAA